MKGFMTAFKPITSFVHEFVTLTREVCMAFHTHRHAHYPELWIGITLNGVVFFQRNVSEIKSTVFTQFLLNWTLSEVADMYRPMNASVVPQVPKFDVTDVEDWYRQVVLPLLRRFLPNAEAVMHKNIKLAFHQVLYVRARDNTQYFFIRICDLAS